jgi:hypothetical protein
MSGVPKHGHNTRRYGKSPEYNSWDDMISRCYRPSHGSYKNYGARGIAVCQRWRDSFEAFLNDMGLKPSADYSIDRKDGNKGYAPDNCRWSTRHEQNSNRRPHRKNKRGKYPKFVTFSRGAYQVAVTVLGSGKQKYVGRFKTEAEAVKAAQEEVCRQSVL